MSNIKGDYIFDAEDVVMFPTVNSIGDGIDRFEDELKKDQFTNYDKTIDDNLGNRGRENFGKACPTEKTSLGEAAQDDYSTFDAELLAGFDDDDFEIDEMIDQIRGK